MTSNEIVKLFFTELKQYNSTNFRTIEKCNLEDGCDSKIYKSFSSVVTRYFIFKERHPELDEASLHTLYYRLGIDMIAKFFSEYPKSAVEDLEEFQDALLRNVKHTKNRSESPIRFNPPVITEASVTIGG